MLWTTSYSIRSAKSKMSQKTYNRHGKKALLFGLNLRLETGCAGAPVNRLTDG